MAPPASHTQPTEPAGSSSPSKAAKSEKRWSSGSRSSQAPVSFFLKSQDQMDADRASEPTLPTDSTFGVESLQDTISTANLLQSTTETADARGSWGPSGLDSSDGPSLSMPVPLNVSAQLECASAALSERSPSLARAMHLYDPHSLDSGPFSTPKSSSVRSFLLSEDELSADEASSQALASSDEGDEEDHNRRTAQAFESSLDEVAPQLVMPSIRMPARRPFTEKGKNLGKLKIMVAGSAHTGKTSLIRSIVQICDEIVHVDPVYTPFSRHRTDVIWSKPTTSSSNGSRQQSRPLQEIQASTRPYPSWWADLEESRVLRRRKSFDDTVLERNVSFIDTPGFDDRLSFEYYSTNILTHIQGHLHRNAALSSLSEAELLSILTGNGGFQVDLILYTLSGIPDTEEVAFIRRLSQLTNLIPVAVKSDIHPGAEFNQMRYETARALREANVEVFDIRKYSHTDMPHDEPHTPFAVSCAFSRDDDNMDASLLMSSAYVAPLEPSQLKCLVDGIFDPDMAACLRHSASKKYLQWHRSYVSHAPSMSIHSLRPGRLQSRATSFPSRPVHNDTSQVPNHSFALVSTVSRVDASPEVRVCTPTSQSTPPSDLSTQSTNSSPLFPLLSTTNPYAVARITDHTQREERLAQAHLARWAGDLHRALRNERAHFAALQQAERQAWLRDRLEECVDINACKEGKTAGDAIVLRSPDMERRDVTGRFNAHDPLGLLKFHNTFSRRGLLLAQVVGSAGVVSAVLVWAMKVWGWEVDFALDRPYSLQSATGWTWSSE